MVNNVIRIQFGNHPRLGPILILLKSIPRPRAKGRRTWFVIHPFANEQTYRKSMQIRRVRNWFTLSTLGEKRRAWVYIGQFDRQDDTYIKWNGREMLVGQGCTICALWTHA